MSVDVYAVHPPISSPNGSSCEQIEHAKSHMAICYKNEPELT